MEKTLSVINSMHKQGLFQKYAIGGGIATLFYIEPVATFDLDIFIILPENKALLVSLSPLYEWLKDKGHKPVNEQVVVEGIPVQFIPVYNELVKEAVLNAVEKKYEKIRTFVLRQEYLVAIMLQTNRPKDRERVFKMLDECEISKELLDQILERHGLKNAYSDFRRKFYE